MSLEHHIRRRQLDLAESVRHRRPIYLDLKFWIELRDVVSETSKSSEYIALLQLLRKLVSDQCIFCPISDSTFIEVLKQSDARTRKATAQLIDELSLGISIVPFETRVGTEVSRFLQSFFVNSEALYPLEDLAWCSPSFALGLPMPNIAALSATQNLSIQQEFVDHIWQFSFSSIIETIGHSHIPNVSFDPVAARINDDIAAHSDKIFTFQQVLSHEIEGAADVFSGVTANIICNLAAKAAGTESVLTGEEHATYRRLSRNLLMTALAQQKNKTALRTLYSYVCLHAFVRWNKGHRLKGNDFFDFRHACGALGYCHAFLTEKPLRAMVTAGHVALDHLHGCKVIVDASEALAYLVTI